MQCRIETVCMNGRWCEKGQEHGGGGKRAEGAMIRWREDLAGARERYQAQGWWMVAGLGIVNYRFSVLWPSAGRARFGGGVFLLFLLFFVVVVVIRAVEGSQLHLYP